jgi:hypothetical protein
VLAPKLVYQTTAKVKRLIYDANGDAIGERYDINGTVWRSTITDQSYNSKEKALAATVAKLKEVEK